MLERVAIAPSQAFKSSLNQCVELTKPFFTTRTEGNGLGLAIVKRIVEAHGGSLAIAATAREGTTVTVCLPAESPREPQGNPL